MRVTIKQRARSEVRLKAVSYSSATIASEEQAEGGSDNVRYMTSLRTKQQITERLADEPTAEAGADGFDLMTSIRTKQAINTRLVTPEDYPSIQAAIDAVRNVEGRPGAAYTHTGVSIGNSDSFDGKNAVVTADVGSALYTLSAYDSVVERVYIADNRPSRDGAIQFAAGRFQQARYIISPNTGAMGVKFAPAPGGYVALPDLIGLKFEGITGTGVSIGSSVTEIHGTHLYFAGKLDFVGGLGRPQAGTVGWRQNTPVVGGFAVGGHQITAVNTITVETGWWLTDAQLSNYSGIIADGTRGYGIVIDGASDKITFCNTFVGTSMGIRVAGTAQNIKFDGLETRFIGVIPPWGQKPFYNTAGPYYAMTVEDTAKVVIDGDSWTGDKRVSVASTASLTVTGGFWFRGRNSSNIAAGATAYLAEKEYTAASDAIFRVPYTGYLFLAKAVLSAAPGSGESMTFTVQINGVDTAMTFTVSGTSSFSGSVYGPIFVTTDQSVTLKVAKSSGMSANGRYNFEVQMLGE